MDHVHVIAHGYYLGPDPEFSRYALMGVPVISAPQSLETLMRCYDSGLVAVDHCRGGVDLGFSEAMVEALLANTQPVKLPEECGIRAYTWSEGGDVMGEMDCPALEAHRAPRF